MFHSLTLSLFKPSRMETQVYLSIGLAWLLLTGLKDGEAIQNNSGVNPNNLELEFGRLIRSSIPAPHQTVATSANENQLIHQRQVLRMSLNILPIQLVFSFLQGNGKLYSILQRRTVDPDKKSWLRGKLIRFKRKLRRKLYQTEKCLRGSPDYIHECMKHML